MDVTRVAGNGAQSASPPPTPSVSVDTAPARVSVAPTPPPAPPPAAPIQDVSLGQAGERPADRGGDGDILRRAVSSINTTIRDYGRHLGIRLHEATGRHVVTVYDSHTNEAVREIPPESVLDAHANLLELAGLFVDTRG